MMSYTITETAAAIYLNGKSYFLSEPAKIEAFKKLLASKAPEAEVEASLDKLAEVKKFAATSGGRAQITEEGAVIVDGQEVHSVEADRAIEFAKKGLPAEPLLAFITKVRENPSHRSRTCLYTFLEKWAMPVTPDGCFLSYKAVKDSYMDKYKGVYLNKPGCRVSEPRRDISDDPNQTCSYGLHAGNIDYAAHSYGSTSGRWRDDGSYDATVAGPDRIVIVKIDPADVVSVPDDHEAQKLRTCAYEVVAEYSGKLPAVFIRPDASDSYHGYCGDDLDDEEDGDDLDDSYLCYDADHNEIGTDGGQSAILLRKVEGLPDGIDLPVAVSILKGDPTLNEVKVLFKDRVSEVRFWTEGSNLRLVD